MRQSALPLTLSLSHAISPWRDCHSGKPHPQADADGRGDDENNPLPLRERVASGFAGRRVRGEDVPRTNNSWNLGTSG